MAANDASEAHAVVLSLQSALEEEYARSLAEAQRQGARGAERGEGVLSLSPGASRLPLGRRSARAGEAAPGARDVGRA